MNACNSSYSYRSLSSEASGAGPSSSRGSASLPTTPFSSASASSSSSASRKHAWSGSSAGARKRAASAKLPPPISGATPRVTRSTSARAASGASVSSSPLSHAVKRSSTGGAAGGNGGAEATPLPTLAPPTQSETVKEKEQVKLSPLHQALVDCVKTRPGKRLTFLVKLHVISVATTFIAFFVSQLWRTLRCP